MDIDAVRTGRTILYVYDRADIRIPAGGVREASISRFDLRGGVAAPAVRMRGPGLDRLLGRFRPRCGRAGGSFESASGGCRDGSREHRGFGFGRRGHAVGMDARRECEIAGGLHRQGNTRRDRRRGSIAAIAICLLPLLSGCASSGSTPYASKRFVELSRAERAIGADFATQGATALGLMLDYWRIEYAPAELAGALNGLALGTGLEEAMMEIAEARGLWTYASYSSMDGLKDRLRTGIPVIVGAQDTWKKLNTRRPILVTGYAAASDSFTVRDQGGQTRRMPAEELQRLWRPVNFWMLLALPADRPAWTLNFSERASRARWFERRGDLAAARRDYEAALEEAPAHPGLQLALANLLLKAGDPESAKRLYRQAVAANPEDGRAANNLAFVLADEPSALKEAADLAQRAARLEPTNPATLDTLGYIYLKQGNYIAAAAALERAHARARQLPEAQRHEIAVRLARAHLGRGEPERARAVLDEILQLQPDYPIPADLARVARAKRAAPDS